MLKYPDEITSIPMKFAVNPSNSQPSLSPWHDTSSVFGSARRGCGWAGHFCCNSALPLPGISLFFFKMDMKMSKLLQLFPDDLIIVIQWEIWDELQMDGSFFVRKNDWWVQILSKSDDISKTDSHYIHMISPLNQSKNFPSEIGLLKQRLIGII